MKVRCELWKSCKDHDCKERQPHDVRRDGAWSCRRKSKCDWIGKTCRCVPVEKETR